MYIVKQIIVACETLSLIIEEKCLSFCLFISLNVGVKFGELNFSHAKCPVMSLAPDGYIDNNLHNDQVYLSEFTSPTNAPHPTHGSCLFLVPRVSGRSHPSSMMEILDYHER